MRSSILGSIAGAALLLVQPQLLSELAGFTALFVTNISGIASVVGAVNSPEGGGGVIEVWPAEWIGDLPGEDNGHLL